MNETSNMAATTAEVETEPGNKNDGLHHGEDSVQQIVENRHREPQPLQPPRKDSEPAPRPRHRRLLRPRLLHVEPAPTHVAGPGK